MPRPISQGVHLSDSDRDRLAALIRAGSTPQALAFRCRLLLRIAAADQPTNLQIAAEFRCDRHTAGVWRKRYLRHGWAGLQEAPRSGRPRSFPPLATA
jgi:Winged helix-turn helix